MYAEEDFLTISGLKQFAFCRRRWALMEIEQAWEDNLLTVEGSLLHEAAHSGVDSVRGGVVTLRSLSVFSRTLGIRGVCDIVELHREESGVPVLGRKGRFLPVPVEYKRGKPDETEADLWQVCAQALCLEEMLVCDIPKAQIFYGETKRRLTVELDDGLRGRVRGALLEMHEHFRRGHTPKVKPGKACRSCSLSDICLPKLNRDKSAAAYVDRAMEDEPCESF